MESNTVKISNTELSFYDIGEGKPFVLIHGFAEIGRAHV